MSVIFWFYLFKWAAFKPTKKVFYIVIKIGFGSIFSLKDLNLLLILGKFGNVIFKTIRLKHLPGLKLKTYPTKLFIESNDDIILELARLTDSQYISN